MVICVISNSFCDQFSKSGVFPTIPTVQDPMEQMSDGVNGSGSWNIQVIGGVSFHGVELCGLKAESATTKIGLQMQTGAQSKSISDY